MKQLSSFIRLVLLLLYENWIFCSSFHHVLNYISQVALELNRTYVYYKLLVHADMFKF